MGVRVMFVLPGRHLVPLPSAAPLPERLRAFCGAEFLSGDVSVLDARLGRPCGRCLAVAPLPAADEVAKLVSFPQDVEGVREDVGDGVAMSGNAGDVEVVAPAGP
jgi:hypothetical protein